MALRTAAIALGVGKQTDQTTVNTDVQNATELIVGPASASGATGILLRKNDDLSQTMTREETDGGRTPGSLTRETGTLIRTVPAAPFIIDLKGNGAATGTPDSGDFDQLEYLERLFGGARLEPIAPTSSTSQYQFAANADDVYHTLKIWSGLTVTESWTLVGCSFNLSFATTSGDVTRITVTPQADRVIYNASDTFPDNAINDLAAAYGTQTGAAPICELAASTLDGVARPFQTATLEIAYDALETLNSNVEGGKLFTQSTRNINFSADYFSDSTDQDFPKIEDDMDVAEASNPTVFYRIGAVAGAGEIQEAFEFTIPALRITENVEILSGEQVLRTVSGYAVRQGNSGFGSAANEEFEIAGV